MLKVRKPSPILLFTVVLLLLLPLLAYLQYRWLGQVSEADRERMQASLRRASDEFRDDFDHEIAAVYSSFQPGPPLAGTGRADYIQSYFHWAETTRFSHLIDDILIAGQSNTGPRIERLNRVTRQFEPAPWPAALKDLKAAFGTESQEWTGRGDLLFRYVPRLVDPAIPALFIPILPLPLTDREPEYLVLMLSLDCIEKEILPSFAATLSSDYTIKVIDRENPAKVIFMTGSTQTGRESGDVTTDLFTLRIPELFSAKAGALPLAKARRGVVVEKFSVRVVRGFSVRGPIVGGNREDDTGAWQLVITHRMGSVDAAVAQIRRRNLAVSFGILLLLALSVAIIVISTERARRLAQQQIEFASTVSHELRTPLAVICSAGENLADGVINDLEQTQRYGSLVRDEGRRLSNMIEHVLDFAGIRSGRKIFNLSPTNIHEIVREAVDAFDVEIGQLGFIVETDVNEDVPSIMADRSALVCAIKNLIGNALKYSRDSQWIAISASATAAWISIKVDDRGPGIPQADLPQIFDPFYRGRDAVGAQIRGSGLGLSLVKEIVEAHGGSVMVKSAIGKGSTFELLLPRDA